MTKQQTNTSNFDDIIDRVENYFAKFYDFAPIATAKEFLVSSESMLENFAEHERQTVSPRGNLLVLQQSSDEVFVGINIANDVKDHLAQHNPLEQLTNNNLDNYCVVIEELSHFHLFLNKTTQNNAVSRLELEIQGEIDKVLICALTLQEQHGDPHFLPLARQIFDHSSMYAAHHTESYQDAYAIAAQFWFRLIDVGQSLSTASVFHEKIRSTFKDFYNANLEDKIRQVNYMSQKAA